MKFPWKPRSSDIPTQPGVYRFSNDHGEVMYVGKAKNLRNRVNSYFVAQSHHPRTEEMLSNSTAVDWIIVNSEIEALQLEHTWINEFKPPFNVRFRDDKSYPWICFTQKEEYPRIMVVRGKRRKDNLYFGPYPNAREARELTENLLRVFPIRSCSDTVFSRAQKTNRACILADVGKCSAPCVSRVSAEEHKSLVNDFIAAIRGNFKEKKNELQMRMQEASSHQEFERAALYRDQIHRLESIYQPTSVILNEEDSFDVFAVHADELEVSIQVFCIRNGLLISQKHFVLENVEDLDDAGMLERILPQYYAGSPPDVSEILVNFYVSDDAGVAHFIAETQHRLRIYKPERGRKKEILDLALRNAISALDVHRNTRSHDIAKRSFALNELTRILGLTSVPMRIECIDISHLAGTQTVGSLVVFVDGLPKKSDYRFYNLGDNNDDLKSIEEVVNRRLKRLVDGDTGWNQVPDLLLIDGGMQQGRIAHECVATQGLDIPIFSIAKRFESVFDARRAEELVIPRSSEALFLLQRIRDEAHRFAISQQKKLRKRGLKSQLEDIPGIGPKKMQILLSYFGSLKKIREATVDEIASIPGINTELALKVWTIANSRQSNALNAATGEVTEGA